MMIQRGSVTDGFMAFMGTAVSVAALYAVFRVMLFGVIGWHDGISLDWYNYYYPAIQSPGDPFVVTGYLNPPWLVWLLSPLGLLTAVDSHVLWIVIILLLTVRCVYELGGGWLGAVLTVISPGFLLTVMNGQIDVLVLLGLLTGSWLLILVKPQVAGLAVVYDVIARRRVDWVAVGVAAVSLVAFLLFMTRPGVNHLLTTVTNITPWPWGIPLGIILFIISLLRRDKWLAVIATFFVTPYLSGSSLLVYSAVITSRYGRVAAVVFAVWLWVVCLRWFL